MCMEKTALTFRARNWQRNPQRIPKPVLQTWPMPTTMLILSLKSLLKWETFRLHLHSLQSSPHKSRLSRIQTKTSSLPHNQLPNAKKTEDFNQLRNRIASLETRRAKSLRWLTVLKELNCRQKLLSSWSPVPATAPSKTRRRDKISSNYLIHSSKRIPTQTLRPFPVSNNSWTKCFLIRQREKKQKREDSQQQTDHWPERTSARKDPRQAVKNSKRKRTNWAL